MTGPATTGRGSAPTRRTFLKVAGAAGGATVFSSALGSPARAATDARRAYVLVLDGCRPGEVEQMPTVRALRDAGTWYPRARSLPVMETIPNHVMMMTGVRPVRSGVPANEIYDRAAGEVRTMDRSTDIVAPTVIEQLNAGGRATGTVLSKEYLFGVFGTRATHRWEPFPLLPVTEHAPDVATMQAAVSMVTTFDPHLVFVNLGDVDRVGHADVTGTTLRAARETALQSADAQVKRFVDLLKTTGRWASSLVVVLADHSMDWSFPHKLVSLAAVFDDDASLKGNYQIADNGGADLVYWTGPSADRSAGLARMRQLAVATEGVLSIQDRSTPALALGANAGDLVAYCKAGWRFSDPGPTDNPIPGNHGHPATEPIPFFLSGGHPRVRRAVASSTLVHGMDVAPTLGAFFGLKAPRGGWDGASRL